MIAEHGPQVFGNPRSNLNGAREGVLDNANDLGERMFDLENGAFALHAASKRKDLLDNAGASHRAALDVVRSS